MEESKKKKIIVYSTPTCPHCHSAMDFLRENNIEFEEVNVTESEEKMNEMREKSGQMGVPVIDINGEIVVGFDKEKIKELLGL